MFVYYALDKKTQEPVCRITEVAVRMWCTENGVSYNPTWKASDVFELMESALWFWRGHLVFQTRTEPDIVLDMEKLDPSKIKIEIV